MELSRPDTLTPGLNIAFYLGISLFFSFESNFFPSLLLFPLLWIDISLHT